MSGMVRCPHVTHDTCLMSHTIDAVLYIPYDTCVTTHALRYMR